MFDIKTITTERVVTKSRHSLEAMGKSWDILVRCQCHLPHHGRLLFRFLRVLKTFRSESGNDHTSMQRAVCTLWRTTNCAVKWRTSIHQCEIRNVCRQLGIQTLHIIAVSFAIEWKSRTGSQDRKEFSEEIGRPLESGVGVAKHANVSNQLQSKATANAKTHAGVRASSGAVDETRGTNGRSNPQMQGEDVDNATTILRSKCS